MKGSSSTPDWRTAACTGAATLLVCVATGGAHVALAQQGPRVPTVIRAPHAEIEVAPLDVPHAQAPVLRVTVRPRAGIHIYAPGQRGYYPVALTLAPDSGLSAGRVELPTPESYTFAPTGETFLVYQQPFTLAQHTRRARRATMPGSVRATLRYQACDAEVCYRPVEVPLVWKRGAAQAGKTPSSPIQQSVSLPPTGREKRKGEWGETSPANPALRAAHRCRRPQHQQHRRHQSRGDS